MNKYSRTLVFPIIFKYFQWTNYIDKMALYIELKYTLAKSSSWQIYSVIKFITNHFLHLIWTFYTIFWTHFYCNWNNWVNASFTAFLWKHVYMTTKSIYMTCKDTVSVQSVGSYLKVHLHNVIHVYSESISLNILKLILIHWN